MEDEGIKQIGKNRWQVRVKRQSATTGRRVNRKATVTGTKQDARSMRDRLRQELASTQAQRPRMRLSEYAPSWLAQRAANPDMKRNTIRKYGYGLQHILPVLGDMYLDAITPSDVERYLALRAAQPKAAANTRLNELRLLRVLARDSMRDGYATRYWCDRVKPPKVAGYTREWPNLLTEQQLARLVSEIPTQWRGIVLFIVTTGLRWGEASALHWADVVNGEAFITRGNDRGTLITVKNKSSNRSVPALPEVVALWEHKHPVLVFPSRHGRLHRGTPLRKVLNKACKDAGIPRVTTHGMRRTFNDLARRSTSALVLKAITGHTTDTMMEHYSMVDASEKTAVSRALAERIGVVPQTPKAVN
jgi:integrase